MPSWLKEWLTAAAIFAFGIIVGLNTQGHLSYSMGIAWVKDDQAYLSYTTRQDACIKDPYGCGKGDDQ